MMEQGRARARQEWEKSKKWDRETCGGAEWGL